MEIKKNIHHIQHYINSKSQYFETHSLSLMGRRQFTLLLTLGLTVLIWSGFYWAQNRLSVTKNWYELTIIERFWLACLLVVVRSNWPHLHRVLLSPHTQEVVLLAITEKFSSIDTLLLFWINFLDKWIGTNFVKYGILLEKVGWCSSINRRYSYSQVMCTIHKD